MLEPLVDLDTPDPLGAARAALTRREAQIEALLEAVPDSLFAVDGDWLITLMNSSAEAFFQRRREDVIGRSLWDVFPEAVGTINETLLRAGMAGEESGNIEVESVTRPGRYVRLRITRKATGGLALLFADITDQRDAQIRERAQADEFRALADNIPALCWMTYADGHVYWFNSRWYDYTGTSPDTQIGWGWGSVHDPAILPAVHERWQSSLRTGNPFEMVFPLKREDGVFHPFLVRAVPVRDDAGTIIRWFGSCTEIDDQVRQQQRLRTMVDELNHRVKNTLATVQSLAVQTMRGDKPGAFSKFENRLMALASGHDLLTQKHWEEVELAEVVERCQGPHGDRISAAGPPVILQPQAGLALCMCLHELTTNSIKYGAFSEPAGRVEITWTLCAEDGQIRLIWRELGGPEPVSSRTNGFGTRLVDKLVRHELAGTVAREFTRTGLVVTATIGLKVASRWRNDFNTI